MGKIICYLKPAQLVPSDCSTYPFLQAHCSVPLIRVQNSEHLLLLLQDFAATEKFIKNTLIIVDIKLKLIMKFSHTIYVNDI